MISLLNLLDVVQKNLKIKKKRKKSCNKTYFLVHFNLEVGLTQVKQWSHFFSNIILSFFDLPLFSSDNITTAMEKSDRFQWFP